MIEFIYMNNLLLFFPNFTFKENNAKIILPLLFYIYFLFLFLFFIII